MQDSAVGAPRSVPQNAGRFGLYNSFSPQKSNRKLEAANASLFREVSLTSLSETETQRVAKPHCPLVSGLGLVPLSQPFSQHFFLQCSPRQTW